MPRKRIRGLLSNPQKYDMILNCYNTVLSCIVKGNNGENKMEKILCLLLTIMGGTAAAIQSPVNSGLGKRIGTLEAGFISFLGGFLLLAILVFVFGKGNLGEVVHAPKWQLIGGFLGVIAVLAVIIATPRLGVGVTLTGILLGQVAMGLIIDHYGLFHSSVVPASPTRILGVAFIAIGVLLVFKTKM